MKEDLVVVCTGVILLSFLVESASLLSRYMLHAMNYLMLNIYNIITGNIHRLRRDFFRFVFSFIALVSISYMDSSYPDGWGIKPLLKNPHVIKLYPFIHKNILSLLTVYCVGYGGWNILLLLMGKYYTDKEKILIQCNTLQTKMHKCLLERKKCTQIISTQENILRNLTTDYEDMERKMNQLNNQ